jgi:hypothetical protein
MTADDGRGTQNYQRNNSQNLSGRSWKTKIWTKFAPHCLTNEKKALRLQACQEFIQSVDEDHSLLDSIVMGDLMRSGVPIRSPNKKTKHGMGFAKLSKTQTILTSKVKKQTDVGHILQQSGNHSCRMCSTRSDSEEGILHGSIVSFGSENSSRKTSVSGRGSSLA